MMPAAALKRGKLRRNGAMDGPDLAKRDMTVIYGERTFALRAYRQRGEWHSVIIENRTPLHTWLGPSADPALCLAAAVGFVAAVVDASVGSIDTKS
jgi:hypothetical protein